MQRITPMVDDSGAVYEVGDADRPRFDELMKGRAQQRHTYKDRPLVELLMSGKKLGE